jgi:hypothetical protein
MRFKIEIEMDNAAFEHRGNEVARILGELSNLIEDDDLNPNDGGTVRDSNGNTVGSWIVKR